MNIADAIAGHARTRPDHPAIEDGERIVSYAELNDLVTRCAANLHEAGIGAGDVVGVMLPDSADHTAILYALAKLGAISVSINSRWTLKEREQVVAGIGVKAIITGPRAAKFAKATMLDAKDIVHRTVINKSASEDLKTHLPFDENKPLMVGQSSGTTGVPKCFYWSHVDVRKSGSMLAAYLGLTSTDRYLQVPSITFFTGSRRCIMMHCLGATVVINRARTGEQFLAGLIKDKISFTTLTPAHLRPLLASTSGSTEPLLTNTKIIIVSAPLKHAQRLCARKQLTPNVIESYGTNEIGPITFAGPEDQDAYPDSVGRIVEGMDAQVVDESDTPLPTGEVGLVRFRGAVFPAGYLNAPEATARSFRNGWFYPGDLAALNEEGYLFYKGRADDVINNEGVKFYPIEVEMYSWNIPLSRKRPSSAGLMHNSVK